MRDYKKDTYKKIGQYAEKDRLIERERERENERDK